MIFENSKSGALKLLLASILLVTSSFHLAFAEEVGDAGPKLDAVLLLDASGSMRLTDPLRLREEGAKLLLQFMGEEDHLAIVEFSGDTNVIRPLSRFRKSAMPEWQADIDKVGDAGLYTDLLSPIKKATQILKDKGRPDAEPVIILMSDGMMEPDPAVGMPEEFTDELLNRVLPELNDAGIRVYTLYFSEEADPDLLAQIAFATDAVNWFTPTAERIHESYAELFLALKEPQVIPLTSKGFSIDADVREATFYISRVDNVSVTIETPSGERINSRTQKNNIKWFRGQRFDVITVTEPEVGDWKVAGIPEQEGFATALTSLRLVVEDWPPAVYPDVPALLQVRLYESDMPVDLPEVAETLRYGFQVIPTDRISEPVAQGVLRDDGAEGDRVARDGIFSHRLVLSRPGDYQLRIAVEGPTFERHRIIPFRVRPRYLNLTVEPSQSEEGSTDFQIRLSPEALGLRQKEVVLMAVDSARRRHEVPVSALDARETSFLGSSKSLPRDGEYQLQAMLSGRGPANQRVRRESEIVEYRRTSARKPQTDKVLPAVEVVEDEALEDIEAEEVKVDKIDTEPGAPVWPFVALLTLLNGAAGLFAFFKVKTAASSRVDEQPTFEIPDDVSEALQLLATVSKLKEIQLDDPLITEVRSPAEEEDEDEDADLESEENTEEEIQDSEQELPVEEESNSEVIEETEVSTKEEETEEEITGEGESEKEDAEEASPDSSEEEAQESEEEMPSEEDSHSEVVEESDSSTTEEDIEEEEEAEGPGEEAEEPEGEADSSAEVEEESDEQDEEDEKK